MEKKTSKSVAEFLGMCGKHVTVDMNNVEYVQEGWMGTLHPDLFCERQEDVC